MGSIPKQVQRQVERANQLFNQVNGVNGEPPEDTPPAAPQDAAPQVEQPEAPNADAASPEAQATPPASEGDTPAAQAEPPADGTPPQVDDKWERKYKTLQGVLAAEQGRWTAEKKVLEERLRAVETAQAKPASEPAPAAPAKLVTDKDLEQYGPELIDLIGRKATEMANDIVAQQLAQLKPELDRTREQVTSVAGQVYQSVQERFYGELARAVPDWETVNKEQPFLEWLGEVDPLSGVQRQAYLDDAARKLDHARAAALFNAFKAQSGRTAPPKDAPEKPKSAALSPSPRPVGAASAPTPREPETGITRTEIAAHYRRVATDAEYRISPDREAFDKRLAQAMAAGKIIEA